MTACESTIDAIPYTCSNGQVLSVRHDPNMECVIVSLRETGYVLLRDHRRHGHQFSDGAVVFDITDQSNASLTRPGLVSFEHCALEEDK